MRIRRDHEIVNRRYQEWDLTGKKNNESDSELSELASSLFNSMEVIQMGGGIEVGGSTEDLGSSTEDLGDAGATTYSGMRSGGIIKYRVE
jgi:hypothetical protein